MDNDTKVTEAESAPIAPDNRVMPDCVDCREMNGGHCPNCPRWERHGFPTGFAVCVLIVVVILAGLVIWAGFAGVCAVLPKG